MSNVSPTSIVNNLSASGRSTSPQARSAGLEGGTSGGSFSQLLNGYGKPAQPPPAPTDKQLTAQPVPLPPRGLDALPSEALTPASTTAPTPAPASPAYKPETAPKPASPGSNSSSDGKTEAQRQESKLNNRQSGAPPAAAARAATQGSSSSSRLESDKADEAATETAASERTAADSAEAASTATTADAAAQAAAAKQSPASTGLQAALAALTAAAQGAEQGTDGDAQQTGDTRANAGGAGRPGLAGARGRADAGVGLERAQANAQTAPNSTAELGEQATATASSTELQSALLPAQATANGKTAGTALEGMAAALGAGTPGELKAAAASAPPTVVSLAQPLFEPAFAPALAARLSLLTADGVQTAQLHLNPAEMGPVAVQIVVDGQQAQISFHAEQADTCAVLERSLPDLAAALRDAGLTLSGGGVFQQAPGQGGEADSRANNNSSNTAASRARLAGPDSALSALGNAPGPARATRGVLDLYA